MRKLWKTSDYLGVDGYLEIINLINQCSLGEGARRNPGYAALHSGIVFLKGH